MQKPTARGFTLFEILIVVVIISIVMVAGVQYLGVGSARTELQRYGEQLAAKIKLACEQSILQNLPYGVGFSQDGYYLMTQNGFEWRPLEGSGVFAATAIRIPLEQQLEQQGNRIDLPTELPETPQLRCASDGSMTSFRLLLKNQQQVYELMTESSWELRGGWYEE
ncbi:prepilin-type N-terminal cleavage/methylation domain-containing protein [Marinicella sp. W31]|uniref:prepilin-type N-terminal cleavage/methylation domain-containing protein n=1 Tax=Marinicella sp. W31 TaxID=3023713 RepID=UPI0037577E15